MPAKRGSLRTPYFSDAHNSWCIPLTQGVTALVDVVDIEILSGRNWYAGLGGQGWVAQQNQATPWRQATHRPNAHLHHAPAIRNGR